MSNTKEEGKDMENKKQSYLGPLGKFCTGSPCGQAQDMEGSERSLAQEPAREPCTQQVFNPCK